MLTLEVTANDPSAYAAEAKSLVRLADILQVRLRVSWQDSRRTVQYVEPGDTAESVAGLYKEFCSAS